MAGNKDEKKWKISDFLKKCAHTLLIGSLVLIAIYVGLRLYCFYGTFAPSGSYRLFLDGGVIGSFAALVLYLLSLMPSVWER